MYMSFRKNYQNTVLFQDGFSCPNGFQIRLTLHDFQCPPHGGEELDNSRCHGHFCVTDEFKRIRRDVNRADGIKKTEVVADDQQGTFLGQILLALDMVIQQQPGSSPDPGSQDSPTGPIAGVWIFGVIFCFAVRPGHAFSWLGILSQFYQQ